MSRIGKLPIKIPAGVQVTVSEKNTITVKGKLGTLERSIDKDITIEINDNVINVKRPTDQKRHRSLHGLYRALINNMVQGVSTGFLKELELVGVGYKANAQGQKLELSLGYSHDFLIELPEEIKLETETLKGKNPSIKLTSYDKELLGMVVSKIRSFRPPEPYKGKGILYKGEVVRRKAGKLAGE